MQTTECSPPYVSQSGENIKYVAGLLPNGGGLAPSTIGYNAPKTATLLHGQAREPIPSEAGKRKRIKPSAAAPSATKKKAPKKQKVAAADDLPNIDPEVEKFLDEAKIEEPIDDAAADLNDAIEKTPSATSLLLRELHQLQFINLSTSGTYLQLDFFSNSSSRS